MRAKNVFLTSASLGLAFVLLQPADSVAFSTLGFSNNLSQRDVRVFNNFTDAEANNNNVEDPNWPGFDGAEVAIWKACVEWGSALHSGNGNGDPHQPGGVGSGGANFDVSWQGNATEVGGTTDNIHSELIGSSGGTLAFTESLGNGSGWRIRYYSTWRWHDGPDTAIGGGSNYDLQGIAAHEYGHALGLDHSTNAAATMFPSPLGNGVQERSIAADDINGVQFIYGAASAGKATITNVVAAGNQLTITGSNFNASNQNEVWFTQDTAGGNGTPVKVTGVTSDGTTIVVNIPAGAGPGDLLVKRSNQSGNAALSNAWAYDVSVPCGTLINYCTAGTTSNFCQATMTGVGTPSASAGSGFDLQAVGVEGNKQGLIFYGISGPRGTPWGSSQSFLCVKAPTQRTPSSNSGGTAGSCNGVLSVDFNAYIQQPGKLGVPFSGGESIWAQCWFRDPPSIETTNLSDGLEFALCP